MKLPGIYVEIRGDYSHLQKEIKAAKALVTEQATGISNALNNALSPQQVKGSIDKLVANFGTLNRASNAAGDSFVKLGVDLGELRKITGLTEAQLAKLQSQLLKTTTANAQERALKNLAAACNLTEKEIRQLGAQFGLTTAQISKVINPVEKATNSFFTMANIARGTLTYLAISGGQGLVAFGKSVFDVGIKVDSLGRSFAAIAGGQAGMVKELGFLRTVAEATGQNMYSLADSYLKLTASTQNTRIEGEKTKDLFLAMSEAGAVLGLSEEKMSLSLNAFAQMASKGNVSAEELKGQLGDSLPGALNIAATAMGVTTSQLMKMMENGDLLASNLLPKMARELHNMYQSAAQTAALESGQAAVNQLSQAWTDFKANMYNSEMVVGVISRITGAIKALNEDMGSLVPSSERFRAADYLKEEIEGLEAQNKLYLESGETSTEAQIDNFRKRTRMIETYRAEIERLGEIGTPTIKPDGSKVEVTSKKAFEEGRKSLTDYIQTQEDAARSRHAMAMRFVTSDEEIVKADAKLASELAGLHHKGASNFNDSNIKKLEYQKAFEEKMASMARITADREEELNRQMYEAGNKNLAQYLDDQHMIRQKAIDANILAKENELAAAKSALSGLSAETNSKGESQPDPDASNQWAIMKKIEVAEMRLNEARSKGVEDEEKFTRERDKALVGYQTNVTQAAIVVAELNGEWSKSILLQQDLNTLEEQRGVLDGDRSKIDLIKRQNEELEKMKTPLGAMAKGFTDTAAAWKNSAQQMIDVSRETADAMQSGFSDLFFDTMQGKLKSLGDYVTAFMASVQRSIANMMSQQVASGITGMMGSILGGFATGSSTPGAYTMGNGQKAFAKGDVFNSPGLSAYSNKIVSKPTLFPFAKGVGLMGEAGAEAIMPLTRTSNGVLGVKATGGGSNVIVNVIEAPGKGGQQQQRNENGVSMIDVFVEQIKSAVAGDILSGSGAIPTSMQAAYGLNRAAGSY